MSVRFREIAKWPSQLQRKSAIRPFRHFRCASFDRIELDYSYELCFLRHRNHRPRHDVRPDSAVCCDPDRCRLERFETRCRLFVPKLSLIGELNVSISTAFCAQNLDLRSKHLARVRVLVRKLRVLLSVRLILMQLKLRSDFVGREDIILSCLHVCYVPLAAIH
jgi:hypothetical protein